ncbi:ATP-binding cassette domain-containing protein [bacterium]|nr:ATP-binding cassette domain-containing protein [bacterium]
MISTNNISLNFGSRKLFDNVNIKFTPGNCYGLIGANGAGKSTFVKILAGDIESSSGTVEMGPGERLSVLKQDHYAYDEFTVMETVIMGNEVLYKTMKEKDAIYLKDPFTDEDGIIASELESTFAELNGWEAESEAGILLAGLGIDNSYSDRKMSELNGNEKVTVLLAQALFGSPDVLLLDEPTNHLDLKAINWLENFLMDFKNTVIVVSHDRHFLNKVCTHIADIDFSKITVYTGNYDFWRKSAEIAQRLRSDQKRKSEDKAKELKDFIARFSANASKAKQATSRQKQLEKLDLGSLPVSTRKYPYVNFEQEKECGKDMLIVEGLTKTIDGIKVLDNLSFHVNKNDKVMFIGDDLAKTTLFSILAGEIEADAGEINWGVTTKRTFFPNDNSKYFENSNYSLVDWLRQYSPNQDESFIRGFLGRMLFSGEEAKKKTSVLSGGEKVRCMLSRMMLTGSNVLIFDNPTAHLDLESITSLNDGLIQFPGTVIFSSHDHEFIQTIATRIIELDPKGFLKHDKVTDYDSYVGLM